VGCQRSEILEGIKKVLDDGFKSTLSHLRNPYGEGRASEKIVDRLTRIPLNQDLITKRFHDLPTSELSLVAS
jgi:GDP/UDP-N,N'-diacetylbacillosamine 2-epimerase (hydrolysing)